MTYTRTDHGQRLVSTSQTVAVIYFTDGNSRKFYSFDKARNAIISNRDLGINRLRKMVFGWKNRIKTAVIYDNQNGAELHKFKDGVWES